MRNSWQQAVGSKEEGYFAFLAACCLLPAAGFPFTTFPPYTSTSMGIYERDYYRGSGGGSRAGQMQMWSVTTWLIVINVAVFIVDPLLYRSGLYYSQLITANGQTYDLQEQPLRGLGQFSLYLAVQHLELWRVITFQFLHANLMHILFNMFALYFFGPIIEGYLGRGKYLAFYLLCGVAGPIVYSLLWLTNVLIASPLVPLIGASAGIFGILIAAAQLAPTATVLIYGIIPVQLRTLAWILLAVAIYTIFAYGQSNQQNAGGQAAHLGGAAMGYLLINNPNLLRLPRFKRAPFY